MKIRISAPKPIEKPIQTGEVNTGAILNPAVKHEAYSDDNG